MKNVKFTRQELYDLVWSVPIPAILKKYIISDIGIKLHCMKMDIDLPDAVFWSKHQFGKQVIVRNLSVNPKADNEVILMLREDGDEKEYPHPLTRSELQKQIELDKRIKLTVPKKLKNPDDLIVTVKDAFQRNDVWKNPEGILNCSKKGLDIRVSAKYVDRAILFMDTLIKVFKIRGHKLIFKNRQTILVIDVAEFEICCREKLTKVIVKSVWGEHSENKPNGILSFRSDRYNTIEWKDGKQPLEQQLSKIIASLEIKARNIKDERIIRDKWDSDQENIQQIANELQNRKEQELDDFKELVRKAKRMDKTNTIRNYIDEVESRAIAKNDLSLELIEQIAWARKKADWYDPFIEEDDELLQDVDREELSFKIKKTGWRV